MLFLRASKCPDYFIFTYNFLINFDLNFSLNVFPWVGNKRMKLNWKNFKRFKFKFIRGHFCIKFLHWGLTHLTNRLHGYSQRKALMNNLLVMMTSIGWRELNTHILADVK